MTCGAWHVMRDVAVCRCGRAGQYEEVASQTTGMRLYATLRARFAEVCVCVCACDHCVKNASIPPTPNLIIAFMFKATKAFLRIIRSRRLRPLQL